MKIGNYEVHPASELFPMLADSELSDLSRDIKENGLLCPIVLFHGQILDGRNRMAACQCSGVKPRFEIFSGGDTSPTQFVLSSNLRRRHLSASQKAAIATNALPLFEAEAKERQKIHGGTAPGKEKDTSGKNTGSDKGDARDKAAAATGVSARYVSDAKKIKETAPEKFAEIVSGEKSIPQVRAEMKKRPLPKSGPDSLDESKIMQDDDPECNQSKWLFRIKWNWEKSMKRYWKKGSEADRKSFIDWITTNSK